MDLDVEGVLELRQHPPAHGDRGETALDSVAHFHLTNGARLERLNWLADTSANGARNSACIMVNYYYDLSDIVENHERYVTQSEIVASRDVRGWLKR